MGNQCKKQQLGYKVKTVKKQEQEEVLEKQFTFGLSIAENDQQLGISSQKIQLHKFICERFSIKVQLEKPFKLQSLRNESIESFSDISESFEIFSHPNQSFDRYVKRQSQESKFNQVQDCCGEIRNKSYSSSPLRQPRVEKFKQQKLNKQEKQVQYQKKNSQSRSYKSEEDFFNSINSQLLFHQSEDMVNLALPSSRSLKQKKHHYSNLSIDTNSIKIKNKLNKQDDETKIDSYSKQSQNNQKNSKLLVSSTQCVSSNLDLIKPPKFLK